MMIRRARLATVQTNLGYMLLLLYPGPPITGTRPNGVKAINTAIEYCTNNCTNAWPTVSYTYDGNGSLSTVTDAHGETDARGFVTDYTYDSTHGGVVSVTAPAAAGTAPYGAGDRPQVRFSYGQFQARYLQNASTWVNGAAVRRMTQRSSCSAGTSPSCVGTANEALQTVSYPASSTPNNVLPISETSRAGDSSIVLTSTYTYTYVGDVRSVDGPAGGSADITYFSYDLLRREVGVVGPDPDGGGPLKYRATRTGYNAIGQLITVEAGTVTNPTDESLSTFVGLEFEDVLYDQYARPTLARKFNGSTPVALGQVSYDGRGRTECIAVRMNQALFSAPPSSACALGSAGSFGSDRITRYSYDVSSRTVAATQAYGLTLQQDSANYTYTLNGSLESFTNGRGYRTSYTYDGFDRVALVEYPLPSTTGQSSASDYEQHTYDTYGRPYQRRTRSGQVFTYTLDNRGHVTYVDAPGSDPDVSVTMDLFGRVLTQSHSGNVLTMTYDALGNLKTSTSSLLGTVGYLYDSIGRRQRLTYPDGFYVTYGYNGADELTGIFENGSSALIELTYDDLGRRGGLSRGNGVTTSYDHDAISRLSSFTHDAAGSAYDLTVGLSYSPASQITSRSRSNAAFDWLVAASSTLTYSADGLDRYTSAAGASPTYDGRGNLTGDGSKSYGYDYYNRLTSASGGVSLSYDPAGRLQEVSGGAGTARFLYDQEDLIAEYNTSGAVLRRHVFGPGIDEPLVSYDGSGTGNKAWLLADERGSIVAQANSSGAVTQVNKYDANGVPASTNVGRFQYVGQVWLEETGMYHFKARAYHAGLGRFAQTDPIGLVGGTNLYGYAENDSVNAVDPWGLSPDAPG